MENLLVGISIPKKLITRLTPLLHGIPNVEWAESETLHVLIATLRAHDNGQIREWIHFFEELTPQPCCIRLSGVQVQLSKKAKGHIWVLVEDVEGLTEVQHKMHEAAERGMGGLSLVLTPKPHIRLGTINKGTFHHLKDYVEAHSQFDTKPFAVDTLWLYRQRSTPKRMLIEPILSFSLNPEEQEPPSDSPTRPSDPKKSFFRPRPKKGLGNLFFDR